MPLYAIPSRVTDEPDGTVWLEPDPAVLRRRRAVAGALAAVGGGVVATALVAGPVLLAVAAVIAGAAAGVALLVAGARAGCRVGVTPLGVSIVGAGAAHVAWGALSGVRLDPAGRRRRVVVEAGGERYASPGRFQPEAARRWLERCAAAAAGAGYHVQRPADVERPGEVQHPADVERPGEVEGPADVGRPDEEVARSDEAFAVTPPTG